MTNRHRGFILVRSGVQGEAGVGRRDARTRLDLMCPDTVCIMKQDDDSMPARTLGLTETQERGLRVYKRLTEKKGSPPTTRELGAELGVSQHSAWYLTQQLRSKGYLAERPVTVMRLKLSAKGRRAG